MPSAPAHQKISPGAALSLLLHGLVVALWLWWSLAHPARRPTSLRVMLVDLVRLPLSDRTGGAPGGTMRPSAPATAPRPTGTAPKAVLPPPDAMEARIARLAKLEAAPQTLPGPDSGGGGGTDGQGSGASLADYVRAQILRRWWPNVTREGTRGLPVALTLKMTRAGMLSDIRIVDQQRFGSDALFHDMALSARNAAILASPILLPPGRYDAVTQIAITLDPRAVLH